ncbi:uncharacterized protein K02A2.6-like [Mercenaria mercenaria]|uniref:uncharacterized protein K02A2.6-like n=1 Tax=Mercenaria mercenaria TaxID=6596 RepID=UPI00234E7902|nr:uncharacterized protein K02A2.6-like [Mercenaria mercenaria]
MEFAQFAETLGFKHHRNTPEHPRANGEAENFMKILNKTEQTAHTQGKSSQTAIQEMLMGYRSTPHHATGYSPYEALMKRTVRTKLDYKHPQGPILNQRKMERNIKINDECYKQKWRNDLRHPKCKSHDFKIGDKVLLRQDKRNKWTTPCEENYYIILQVNGSEIGARRHTDGRVVYRDASKFKQLPHDIANPNMNNWRGRVIQSITETANAPERNNNLAEQNVVERRIQLRRDRRLPDRFRDNTVDVNEPQQ